MWKSLLLCILIFGFPSPKMVNFLAKMTLFEKFILLAYSDFSNKRTYGLVGIGESDRDFEGYAYDVSKKEYKREFHLKHDSEIHLIIPADFTGEGYTSYVLVTKNKDGRCSNWVYFGHNGDKRYLGDSVAVPLLYADPRDLHPLLLMQRKDNLLESIRITREKDISEEKNEYGRLHEDHTSAFVDIDVNMKACLCLIVKEGGGKVLKVLRNEESGFLEKDCFTMKLPENIGPIIFGDFSGNGMNDMAFVYRDDNGDYYLKIYQNNNSRAEEAKNKRLFGSFILQNPAKAIFSDQNTESFPLKEYFPELTPVLKMENYFGKTPYGIFSADLRAKGRPDIFLVMEDLTKKTHVVALENESADGKLMFKPSQYSEGLSKLENVISVSFCDYNNTGREAFLINRREGDKNVMEAYENDLSKENLKLSLSAIIPKIKKYGSCIPGVSCLISCKNGSKILISTQMPYSTFVHLKHHVAYIGLGTMSLIIDHLIIGVPAHGSYGGPYMIESVAIPNTDLIVYIDKNKTYKVESHFIIGEHYFKIIAGTLLVVAAVNLVLIALLQYRDRRRVVKAKDTDKLHPLFSTLQ